MRQSKNGSANACVDPHRKGKARVRANLGSKEFHVPAQECVENSWFGPGSTNTGPREKKGTNLAKEVVDNEGEEDEGEERTNFPMSLDQALAVAFAYNSVNPNVVTS
jgi:hypothetical protein